MVTDRVPTALVTGASSGLGAAFARRLADDGYGLVLVARDAARLTALAEDLSTSYGTTVQVLAADLTDPESRQTVVERLQVRPGPAGEDVPIQLRPVDLLVNNAGLANRADFWNASYELLRDELELNVVAVLALTHAVLPGLLERGAGGVINVASVAGMVPGRGSTYSAGKAWVISLSEGLSVGLAGTGVRVLALCPGFIRTEFHQRAGIDMSTAPSFVWLSADDVVDHGLRALAQDAVVSVPSLRYKVVVILVKLLPRRLVRRFGNRVGNAQGRT